MSSNLVVREATMEISPDDLEALRIATRLLEHPGFAARLANVIGRPIDVLTGTLPPSAKQTIATAASRALEVALKIALLTMRNRSHPRSRLWHKALAVASGAVGGTFGLATLPIELPISTVIMLRAIASIARSEGEVLSDPEAALACIQVFALGGRSETTSAAESGYFAARGVLAKSVSEAARYVAERGLIEEGAPALVRFIAQVAARFGVVVTQKAAAQAVPVIGAFGGGAVNYAFIDHFQDIARGHFIVRRLERTYGKDAVRTAYEHLRDSTDTIAVVS
ncbi:MAG TPA: EcsC family protein [Xanthobacteraceae bacterium]|jgi:hypothetical protein|nr:EcsC family protein [Xanthobacteraceae bacterium]